MAILGDNVLGPDWTSSIGANVIVGNIFTMPENGIVTSMTCAVGNGPNNSKCAIYNAVTNVRVLLTNVGAVPGAAIPQWVNYTLGAPVALAPGTYYLVNGGDGAYRIGGTAAGSTRNAYNQNGGFVYPAFPDPIVPVFLGNTFDYDIYATYTAAGGSKRLLVNVGI